jgi:hypothetical protein
MQVMSIPSRFAPGTNGEFDRCPADHHNPTNSHMGFSARRFPGISTCPLGELFKVLMKFLCLFAQFPNLGLQVVDKFLIAVNLGAPKGMFQLTNVLGDQF